MMLKSFSGSVVLFVPVLLLCIGDVQGQPAHTGHSASRPDVQKPHLRKVLMNMVRADQKARKTLISHMGSAGKPTARDVRRIKSLDAAHVRRVRKIFNTYGWPGYELVGKKGSSAAWLLVQHADQNRSFQKRALTLLKKAVHKGQASGRNLAYLTDQVRVAEGKPQIYGTQMKTIGQGGNAQSRPYPIENKAKVDARRKRMGLMPLHKHMELMRKVHPDDSQAHHSF